VVSRAAATNRPASAVLPCGTRVRVRNSFGSWAGGFEVVSVDRAGYLLRRISDGALLPMPIVATDVRQG